MDSQQHEMPAILDTAQIDLMIENQELKVGLTSTATELMGRTFYYEQMLRMLRTNNAEQQSQIEHLNEENRWLNAFVANKRRPTTSDSNWMTDRSTHGDSSATMDMATRPPRIEPNTDRVNVENEWRLSEGSNAPVAPNNYFNAMVQAITTADVPNDNEPMLPDQIRSDLLNKIARQKTSSALVSNQSTPTAAHIDATAESFSNRISSTSAETDFTSFNHDEPAALILPETHEIHSQHSELSSSGSEGSSHANDSVVAAPEKPFQCPSCKKTFKNKGQLFYHTKSVCFKRFECKYCGKVFTFRTRLTQHYENHILFQCEHPGCGKIFRNRSMLKRHTRIHLADKPFACDWNQCAEKFRFKKQLRAHKRAEHST